jgi:hypothetical protein
MIKDIEDKKPNYGAFGAVDANFNQIIRLIYSENAQSLMSCKTDYNYAKPKLCELNELINNLVSNVIMLRFGFDEQHLIKCFYCKRYTARTSDSDDGFCDFLKKDVCENSFCYRFFKE